MISSVGGGGAGVTSLLTLEKRGREEEKRHLWPVSTDLLLDVSSEGYIVPPTNGG